MSQFIQQNYYGPNSFYDYNNNQVIPIYPVAPDLEEEEIPADFVQQNFVHPQNYQQPIPGYSQYSYQQYVPFIPPKPPLTRAIHNETGKLLAKASEVSGSILNQSAPKLSAYRPQYQVQFMQPVAAKPIAPVFNFDFSDRHWDMFNNKTEVHHHYHNGGRKDLEKKDDIGIRILVGVIGLTVAFVTAYFAGKAVAQGEDAAEENVGFENLKNSWSSNKFCYEQDHQSQDYRSIVEKIVNRTDAILQRKQTNRTHKIALLVLAFIAGGIGFTGALMGSTPVMTGAVALGALVGIATVFKLGYVCFSTRDKKDAQAIDDGLYELSQKRLVFVG